MEELMAREGGASQDAGGLFTRHEMPLEACQWCNNSFQLDNWTGSLDRLVFAHL